MRYFPILQELFESDTVIFLLIGAAAAAAWGLRLKRPGKIGAGAGVSAAVYALCELGVNMIKGGYLWEILLLFGGTAAIGGIIGFAVAFVFASFRGGEEKQEERPENGR